jgi:hypothetical protein
MALKTGPFESKFVSVLGPPQSKQEAFNDVSAECALKLNYAGRIDVLEVEINFTCSGTATNTCCSLVLLLSPKLSSLIGSLKPR